MQKILWTVVKWIAVRVVALIAVMLFTIGWVYAVCIWPSGVPLGWFCPVGYH